MKATSMAAKAALLTLAGLLGACVPEYHPPTLAEPHAVIKIRRTYDTSAGTNLRELLLVDDHRAFAAEASARLASAPRIDASLVHPMPATFTMASSFFHHETRTLQETYYVQESYYTTEHSIPLGSPYPLGDQVGRGSGRTMPSPQSFRARNEPRVFVAIQLPRRRSLRAVVLRAGRKQ